MTGGKGRQKNDWVMVRFKRIGVDVEVDRVVKGRRNRTKIYQKSGTNIIEASRRRHIQKTNILIVDPIEKSRNRRGERKRVRKNINVEIAQKHHWRVQFSYHIREPVHRKSTKRGGE